MGVKKCNSCKNKLVLLECSCGKVFCPLHFSPGSHDCPKIADKKFIEFDSNNPLNKEIIIPTGAFQKIQKI